MMKPKTLHHSYEGVNLKKIYPSMKQYGVSKYMKCNFSGEIYKRQV